MSRIAKAPVKIPDGVDVIFNGTEVTVKSAKASLTKKFNKAVEFKTEGNQVVCTPVAGLANGWAHAGTARSIINSMVIGVTDGYEKKLQLVGVGYRAKAAGNVLNLTLGFSHPVDHTLPKGITVETPSQTEIVVKGADKQVVGQVAAEIRAYRPPEPYKGKGVKYADERILRKEAKKK